MNMLSPLRYPGGKGQLVRKIESLIKENGCDGGQYIEPYAGGSSISMYLLLNKVVDQIFINDIDISIYAFWHSVINNSTELLSMISSTEITVEEWDRQKEVIKNQNRFSLLDIGFATLFLNRTNRSGILKAGMIGGRKQDGDYKIDCRFNKTSIVDLIRRIAEQKDRIVVSNLDAIEFIKLYESSFTEKAFIYFDPPYYQKGKQLYTNYYEPADHEKLSKFIKNEVQHTWILSYDDVAEIRELYSEYSIENMKIKYSASEHKKGDEIMIFCPSIFGAGYTPADIADAFEAAVRNAIAENRQKGLPIACYDIASKRAFLESADGTREYV